MGRRSKKPKSGVHNRKRRQNIEQKVVPNPLLISVVLAEIFQNLKFSIDDYKNYRLVCKAWQENTLKLWRSNCAIRIGPIGQQKYAPLEWPIETCRAWNVGDFYRTFTNPTNYVRLDRTPYSKYVFKGLYFASTDILELLNEGQSLWNSVGPFMKLIWIEDCCFPTISVNYLVTLLNKKLKNVVSLVLVECRSQFLVEHRHITPADFPPQAERSMSLQKLKVIGRLPMDLFSLLLHCPNLQTLKLYSGSNLPPVNAKYFYGKLSQICKWKNTLNEQPLQIRHLTIKLKMKELGVSIGDWTGDIRLPYLEQFSIDNFPGFYKYHLGFADVLNALATQHAATIRKLEVLEFAVLSARNLAHIPRMSCLEELYLYGNAITSTSLRFIENMPQLRVLYLEVKYYNALDKLRKTLGNSALVKNPEIKNLITRIQWTVPAHNLVRFHCDQDLNPGTWQIVAEWMPNLKALEVMLRSSAFKEVCTLMPNLEELMLLYESEVHDEDITGCDNRGRRFRNPANLTALTNLRKFEVKRMCSDAEKARNSHYRIGDKSVYRGFLELQNLIRVSLHVGKMSRRAEIALRNHVSSVEIIRSYQPGSHESGECCQVVKYMDAVNNITEEYNRIRGYLQL